LESNFLIYASIIVPVHNSADTIENCLEGIRNQKGVDRSTFEIIVVDDASTDASVQKAGRLCDRLISLPENSGAATARNAGANEASGAIIAFVDSDVLLEPYSLSEFIAAFQKGDWISAAVGRYADKPVDNGFLNVYHNVFTCYHHDLSSREINWFWGALSAVRKEVFRNVGGFDERYHGASGEDLALGKTLSDQGYKIAYIPSAQGVHAHRFTIFSMLRNDYLKAVTGMKMKLSQLMPRQVPGFVNAKSIMTSFLLLLIPWLLVLNFIIHIPVLPGIIFFIFLALIIINNSYYTYLIKNSGFRFVFFAPLLHWLQMYTILAGAIMGLCGHLLGRTAFGRPNWI